MSKNQVQLKNLATDEIKTLKTGWSWTCFLFSWLYGIPLFLRGLNVWGGIMLFLVLESHLTAIWIQTEDEFFENAVLFLEVVVMLAFSIWFGVKANRMAIRSYLEKEWIFVDPESESAVRVKAKLNIRDE